MISAPERDEQTVGPRGRLGEALPLIVLAVGLLVVLVVVGADQDITLQRLRDFGSNLYLPQHVGFVHPEFDFPKISPFSRSIDHRPWLETIAFTVTYLGATTAIGSPVVAALRGEDAWPAPVRILAGFLPGYLIVLAPLQLLFDAVPLTSASWIGLVGVPLGAVALHRRALVAGVRGVRSAGAGAAVRQGGTVVAVGLATALVAVALVHRLQQAIFFLTQDSIVYFLKIGQVLVDGRESYLFHWQSQTDEWVFNAPLMFSDGGYGDLWFPFYATQSIAVASFLCLLYGVVHRVARRRKVLAGTVAVAVVFGSTLAIYPWIYVTIVGGGQPVLALAHPGRLVGIIGPWVALLLALTPRRAPLWSLVLLTLGLAFTTLNNVLYVGVAIAAVPAWRLSRAGPGALGSRAGRGGVHALLALALLLPIVAFSFTRGVPSAPAIPALLLLAACAAGLAAAVAIVRGTVKTGGEAANGRRSLAWLGAWSATAILGLLFGDNLGTSAIGRTAHDVLGWILPAYDQPTASRTELLDGVFSGLSFPAFSQGACDANESCGGISNFLLCYGVLFALVVAVWVGYGRLRADTTQVNERRTAVLVGIALIPAVLALVFFTGAETLQASTFTRMFEWPVYSLLVLAVLGFCEARSRVVAFGGAGIMLVWAIVPLISYQWPEQMVRNAGWYLERLF